MRLIYQYAHLYVAFATLVLKNFKNCPFYEFFTTSLPKIKKGSDVVFLKCDFLYFKGFVRIFLWPLSEAALFWQWKKMI